MVVQFFILGAREQVYGDFHAFYCGGTAVLHGLNPYHTASIASCESTRFGFGVLHTAPGVTAPVPFPGYVFALFAPFALLPFLPAALAWFALSVLCMVFAVRCMASLCGLPQWCIAVATGCPYVIAVLGLGEVAPIVLAALCGGALALRSKRYWSAALAMCVSAVLPHVVLPAFGAVFIFQRGMRVPLLVCGGLLVALDVAIGGPAMAVEYFRSVLPAHADSEIGYIAQYGLTWALHGLGVADRLAVSVGDVSYAIACIAGIAVAAMLYKRRNDSAWLLLLPVAFAVTGGPFMHFSEITLAFPALFLLVSQTRERAHWLAAGAVLLLAVPWQWLIGEPQLAIPVSLAACVALAYALFGRVDAVARTAFAAALFEALLLVCALRFGPQVEHHVLSSGAGALAQASWTTYIRGQGSSTGIVWWIAKLPTWTALLLLCAGSAYVALHKDGESASIVDGAPLPL